VLFYDLYLKECESAVERKGERAEEWEGEWREEGSSDNIVVLLVFKHSP